ncbi:hypothetical protein GE061_015003 [Apolygus lucorum]|uniref:Uncharacterized protein n=1 Tax=Apolygus lucorum TaxID=248454 RepID=A0A8S9XLY1_APOLU|nr:hypothetical protein GE061_015003 [Apolygus lucorum]
MDVETVSPTIEQTYQVSHAPQNAVEEPVRGTPVAVMTGTEAVDGVFEARAWSFLRSGDCRDLNSSAELVSLTCRPHQLHMQTSSTQGLQTRAQHH